MKIEPVVYLASMSEWTTLQNISHWVLTCTLWGIIGYAIVKIAKNKCGFNLFQNPLKMKMWQWILVLVCVALSLFLSYIDWNGFKIVKEIFYNGWLKLLLFTATLFIVTSSAFSTDYVHILHKKRAKWHCKTRIFDEKNVSKILEFN